MTCVENRWSFVDKHKKYVFNKKLIKCGCIILSEDLKYIALVQNIYAYNSGIEQWGLPKGKIEYKESYAKCANREVLEETGLKINVLNNMFKVKIMNSYYFPIIVDKNTLIPNDITEIKYANWFEISTLNNIPINRETKLCLKYKLDEIIKLKHYIPKF